MCTFTVIVSQLPGDCTRRLHSCVVKKKKINNVGWNNFKRLLIITSSFKYQGMLYRQVYIYIYNRFREASMACHTSLTGCRNNNR